MEKVAIDNIDLVAPHQYSSPALSLLAALAAPSRATYTLVYQCGGKFYMQMYLLVVLLERSHILASLTKFAFFHALANVPDTE